MSTTIRSDWRNTALLIALSLVPSAAGIVRLTELAHEWMIRAYAIGLGAGTQVLTHLPYYVFVGKPDAPSRAVLMGAGWVINLVIAEWIIRRPRARRAKGYATCAMKDHPAPQSLRVADSQFADNRGRS